MTKDTSALLEASANIKKLPEPDPSAFAVFCDVDGTLVDIASTPDRVDVSSTLIDILAKAAAKLDGAFALISGRVMADLDRMFAPHQFAAAAIHGLEIRKERDGAVDIAEPSEAFVMEVDRLIARFSETDGVVIEDKYCDIALHYRLAPHMAAEIEQEVRASHDVLGDGYTVLHGKMLYEIKPAGVSKGTAVEQFMSMAPFSGRTPIYFGDDVTDEDGFAAVKALGGVSVRIGDEGEPTVADIIIPANHALLEWLDAIAADEHPGGG